MSHEAQRGRDVFPGSSTLVEGSVPVSSLLLIGPTGIGKTMFSKQFIYNGLRNGEPCIYVSTDEPPEEICSSMKKLGFDVDPFILNDTFRIVDCYSWKLEKSSKSKYVVSNPSNCLSVLKAIDDARDSFTDIRLVLDSITGFTSICQHSLLDLVRFLQILVARIRAANGKAIFIAVPEAHDPQLVSHLRLVFDGILEMKEDESSKQIKRLFRIFSLKEAKHKTIWTPFEITESGIVFRSESKLRCEMCSALIEWNPQVEIINGEKHVFDKPECANTYKKLKGVYGKNFK
jgi:KaiC/GvpD/RAD55 family RecA-like ATPase